MTQKVKTYRSPKYLAWIRTQPCCISGMTETVVAHHVRINGTGGMGLKPSDYQTVPLANNFHAYLHRMGERSFWDEYRKDPNEIMFSLLRQFQGNPEPPLSGDIDWLEYVRHLEKVIEGE